MELLPALFFHIKNFFPDCQRILLWNQIKQKLALLWNLSSQWSRLPVHPKSTLHTLTHTIRHTRHLHLIYSSNLHVDPMFTFLIYIYIIYVDLKFYVMPNVPVSKSAWDIIIDHTIYSYFTRWLCFACLSYFFFLNIRYSLYQNTFFFKFLNLKSIDRGPILLNLWHEFNPLSLWPDRFPLSSPAWKGCPYVCLRSCV